MKSITTSENNEEKNPINMTAIPTAGSLGLLALGAVGIKAWREKREEEKEKLKAQLEQKNG
jgi:hypothetical protein